MFKGFASKLGSSGDSAVWGRTFLPWAFAAFIGLLVADLGIIYSRSLILPTSPLPPRPPQQMEVSQLSPGTFQGIRTRNIFSAKGIIPEAISNKGAEQQPDAAPVPSTLPITLVGTLVHSNPEKSIASIEIKSKNQVLAYGIKKDIEGMATIESIERGKVFLRNNSTGRLEFIELKMDSKINFAQSAPEPNLPGGSKDVKVTGQNQYEIKRGDLTKYTKDLSSVLMQARAVPAKRPSGETYGFRVLEIQPGSIFAQLGIMPMDVIMGVNGNPVTDPQQAMAMYQALQNADSIRIMVERNGHQETLNYSVTK